jgi:hypothetical protein
MVQRVVPGETQRTTVPGDAETSATRPLTFDAE